MTQQVTIVKTWLPDALSEFRAISKPMEYKDLIRCQSPKFSAFIAQYGRSALETIFEDAITDVSQVLGLPVVGRMVAEAVDILIDDHPEAKMSDILLFKRLMVKGHIGGQIGDNIWKWNARTICQSFAEYFEKSNEAIREVIDQRHEDMKANGGEYIPPTEKDIPMPDYVKENLETLAKKLSIDRIREDRERKAPNDKLTLAEIADLIGVDKEVLADRIKSNAMRNLQTGLSEEKLISIEFAKVQYEARKDSSFLNYYISPTK